MPSFIFHSNQNETEKELLFHHGNECIVPRGFNGTRGNINSSNTCLRWHIGTHVSLEQHHSDNHGFAVLIGEAIAEESDDYLSAESLFAMIANHKEAGASRLSRYSGFYAWIVVLDDETVYCGSDPFGLFPIYYFKGESSFSIATSLKALHAHPEYDATIDPIGFCRYLMENGGSGHRTLERSGKRLNIAESIRYQPVSNRLTISKHSFPGQHAAKSIYTLDEAVDLSIEASSNAVKRHTQRSVETCLLSGGLDSRQILSTAQKLGLNPKCVTLGSRDSYENICASKVAKKLKLAWECSDNRYDDPQEILKDELNLFSLGGGFNGLTHSWGQLETLRNSRCLTGLYLDITYAPFREAYANTSLGSYADSVERCIHHFGIFPSILSSLVEENTFKQALQTALSEVQNEWEQFPEDPHERHWHTIARFRARPHHGRLIWKNAFYFWPVIPALDVPLTESIRTIDGQLMQSRKLQNETFIKMQPGLAAIPFASAGGRPRPLIKTRENAFYKQTQKLERRYLRLKKKYLKNQTTTPYGDLACWTAAKDYAVQNLDATQGIFDIEMATKLTSDFCTATHASKANMRDLYSQRLLIGSICWLAYRRCQD
ncbi:MAG TPA: hypothetical protein DCX06_10375 [Opitutae bacterium]|nr:hypothetical protein [Opitutae bacterium]